MQSKFSKICLFALASFLLFSMFTSPVAKGASSESLEPLYIEIGDALMKAKDGDWQTVKNNISTFAKDWSEVKASDSKKALDVDKNIELLINALGQTDKNASEISQLLSSLSKALVSYDKEQNPVDKEQEREKIRQLLPYIAGVEKDIQGDNFDGANTKYQQFLTNWTENEVIVRNQSVASYGEIETQIAIIRIALSQTPPNKEQALTSIQSLKTAFNNFLSGKNTKVTTTKEYSLNNLMDLLEKSEQAIADNDAQIASENLNQVMIIWPAVEGDVRTRDHDLYNRMENDIPAAISLLNSQEKDFKKASIIVADLQEDLQLIATKTSYSFVDALLVLLREGLEALLIIAGLVAFLKKTNHSDKQVWIWSGVVGGVIASAVLAVVINLFFSTITAATSREYLEGIIGIVAVIMMLTVGAWLHKKTNINHWNKYIKDNLGKALAKGSLISMTTLSFLSIFREGAETIIFYAGMAPSMEVNQLVLGICIAFVILIILGFVIIRYSKVIPLRPFFMVATILIYVLAFKMLGVSIHALQVANVLPVHAIPQLPYVGFIGLYPTIETLIPQLILLVGIAVTTYLVGHGDRNHVPVSAEYKKA